MKSQLKLFSPASSFSLVLGLNIGGLVGWYAGQQPENFQTAKKSIQMNSQGYRGSRSPIWNSDSGNSDEVGNTNIAANAKDLAKAVRSIFRENVKDRRIAMFGKMAESVSLDRFPDLVALVRENDLRGNDTGDEWSRLWTIWAKRDPIGAMDFIYDFDWAGWDPAARGHARNSTLSNWAQIDPQAVRKFVEEGEELANGDRQMVMGFVEGWANVDPKAAADWLFKTGLGKSSEYEAVVQAMNRGGSQDSVDAWFAGLDPAIVSTDDMKGLARAIAQQKQEYEPEKAAAWVEANLKEPWVKDSEIVGNTARAFAHRDPKAAMEWAGKTGLGPAAIQAMDVWCEKDLDTASKWLNENSQDSTYSESAQVVMAHLRHRDPAVARHWAESLANTALGDQLLKQFGD